MSKYSANCLHLSNLSFAWPGGDSLFEDLTLTFSPGWTAILGDNGIGKSTLVRIAAGLDGLAPTSGTIVPKPGSRNFPRTAYCPQDTDERSANLFDFGADWSPQVQRIRSACGIGDDWAYRYDTLSGGERKRLQIACALALFPRLLILDEPTNHVDSSTREAIARALVQFGGHDQIGILISHDRDLVDAVADRCVFLSRRHTSAGNVTRALGFEGGYTQARAALRAADAAAGASLALARAEADRLTDLKTSRRQKADQAHARMASGSRIDRHDHDALARHKLAKMTSADSSAGRASARVEARLTAARRASAGVIVAAKRYSSGLAGLFGSIEPSHRRLLAALGPGVVDYAPNVPGVAIPRLEIGPVDHIGLVGDNGTGKSTLVRRILQALPAEAADDVLSIEQETTAKEAFEALRSAGSLDRQTRARVMEGYAQLNSDPDRLSAAMSMARAGARTTGTGELLSPGELRKLLICLGIVTKQPALLLLDEPTNHLDLGSIEALGAALAAWKGALLLVSHDRRLVEQCTSLRWAITRTGGTPPATLAIHRA